MFKTKGKNLTVWFIVSALILAPLISAGPYIAEAKKSYKLIVYLDKDFPGGLVSSFKVNVFNSDHKKIVSDKVTPDLSDFHQKISPKSGYKITDKSGQHPSQIKVCAGQPASGGEHNDCFGIKQNKAKTYWYSIFDYGTIEGFEDD